MITIITRFAWAQGQLFANWNMKHASGERSSHSSPNDLTFFAKQIFLWFAKRPSSCVWTLFKIVFKKVGKGKGCHGKTSGRIRQLSWKSFLKLHSRNASSLWEKFVSPNRSQSGQSTMFDQKKTTKVFLEESHYWLTVSSNIQNFVWMAEISNSSWEELQTCMVQNNVYRDS